MISRRFYETIWRKKTVQHDLYPFLVFIGGPAAVELYNEDNNLHVPAGIYSDLDELKNYFQVRLKKNKWALIKFWDFLSDKTVEPYVIAKLLNLTSEYEDVLKEKSEGFFNVKLIQDSLRDISENSIL